MRAAARNTPCIPPPSRALHRAMLTLCLLRHAKSSWDDPRQDDFDRPLTKRGTRAASEIGAWLAANAMKPDLILCSSAVRTQATLALVLRELGAPPPPVEISEALYLAPAGDMLDRIKTVKGSPARLMVIGHNPGLHTLALSLLATGERSEIARLAMGFPTGALAVILFDVTRWSDIRPSIGRLARFVSPRSLG